MGTGLAGTKNGINKSGHILSHSELKLIDFNAEWAMVTVNRSV